MADKFLSSVNGAGFRVVARGVYTGASGGTVTIPEVDMERTTVNLLSSAYANATYVSSDISSFQGAYLAGSIYIQLTSSTEITINNQVKSINITYGGGGSTQLVTEDVPVSYEVVTYA